MCQLISVFVNISKSDGTVSEQVKPFAAQRGDTLYYESISLARQYYPTKQTGYDSVNFSHYNKKPENNTFKLFVFDMDSTLIDAEVIDELAKAAGVEEKVSRITEAAMSGEMDYTESFQMRVSSLKGLSYDKALAETGKIQLMPGAAELIQYIHENGGKTAMLTCGFSIMADKVKEQLGLDYVYSNDLVVKDGYLTGEATGPLMVTNAKEVVLGELVKKTGIPFEECLVVGDGANDICLFEKAGFSIAFNAKPRVQEKAHAVVSKKDLRSVIPILESVTAPTGMSAPSESNSNAEN
ncbi:phosphoserine phosphatase SerB [Methanimicrococcus blatticola]|nr:phosphoserine phosphatase SerB [Methanimicrococcus blatticola]MBZ3935305.1 phosphoserine phosphatase SerB [Methanimicrococcus blatticola]